MGVSDEKLIRVEAIKRFLDGRGVPPDKRAAYLAENAGSGRKSYWSGVLGGHRSFGEKAARGLEESLGLPRGALDDPSPTREPTQPPAVRPPAPVVTTPEESILLSYLRELPNVKQRWLLEQAIRLRNGGDPWPQSMTTIIGLLDSLPPGERNSACIGIEAYLQERIERRWLPTVPEGKAPPASSSEDSPQPEKPPRESKS